MSDDQKWKCSNCGYTVQQKIPPDKCPSCSKSCGFIDISCYIPDCSDSNKDDRL